MRIILVILLHLDLRWIPVDSGKGNEGGGLMLEANIHEEHPQVGESLHLHRRYSNVLAIWKTSKCIMLNGISLY
jgi:hypothetical protein